MSSQRPTFIRISFREMYNTFETILLRNGFTEDNAKTCAHIFATNSLEGIYTHGVNRFPKFVQYCQEGYVKIDAEPSRSHQFGGIEQWDGNLGPGVLNALHSTDRAMELASQHGIGCVALSNTNHWMRGGYYGWQAAKKGFVFIGWTNTLANMPAWGGVDAKLGNNPLVIAVPFGDDAIVVDTAMSQYSYGALDQYRSKKEKLPVPGGYDKQGNLSTDPDAIRETGRVLPIGYWKGAGLSLLLDIVGTILSGGLSTSEISKLKAEHALSQMFIAFDLSKLQNNESIQKTIKQIIDDYHAAIPVNGGKQVRYPGERIKHDREVNRKEGIPVSEKIWNEVLGLK
jgi:3-dehydro-L-gulonate 2-dehydrogenase